MRTDKELRERAAEWLKRLKEIAEAQDPDYPETHLTGFETHLMHELEIILG